MREFKKGDLVFIDRNQFTDAVNEFHSKWTATETATEMAMATATAMATETAMATATEMATATATATAMETYFYTVKNRQSGKSIRLKYCGVDWKALNQNLTGIIQKVVSEQHPDFDMLKVYCQQEGSVRVFRRYILERSASRQPDAP